MTASIQAQQAQLHQDIQNLLPELRTMQEAALLVYQTGEALDLKESDQGRACLRVVSDFDLMLRKLKDVLEATDELIAGSNFKDK